MYVHVDQPRRQVQTGDINGLFCCARGYRRLDGSDLAVQNGNVPLRVDIILGVDDMAVTQNEIVLLRLRRESKREKSDKQDANHRREYNSAILATTSEIVFAGLLRSQIWMKAPIFSIAHNTRGARCHRLEARPSGALHP